MSVDPWVIYGETLTSRLFLGTARYPSPKVMADAVEASGTEVLTVGMRRQAPSEVGGGSIWEHIAGLGRRILPNTAGCHTAQEAVNLAEMAREIFDTNWIKLEVVGGRLQPAAGSLRLDRRHPTAHRARLQGVSLFHR